MKKIKEVIRNVFKTILRIAFIIASILLILGFFRWAGIKGFIAFLLGMGIMAYLLLSKNMMFQGIIEMFGADEYITDIGKKK